MQGLYTERPPAFIHEPWLEHARRTPEQEAIIHWSISKAPQVWTWAALVDAAGVVASRLRAKGVETGEVCATILRHDMRFYPIYLGIVLAGAIPAVLAYPNARLHPDKFRQGLDGMLQNSGFDWMLTESDLTEVLGPIARHAGTLFRAILFPYDWPAGPTGSGVADADPTGAPDQPCLLQHSSGTTGLQKPVMLSHRAVLDHLARFSESIALTRDDRIVSWLPLYHDMGLIAAFHLPLRYGVPVVQIDPFEWVKWPTMMLDVFSTTRATLAWLPNFAYNLMALRADPSALQDVRLDSVRMLINCSEPVRAASHQVFFDRCRSFGLNEGALAASYAMAEATFAVTQTRPGERARELAADRLALVAGSFVATVHDDARVCVSSGRPIADCTLRIVDAGGRELADDRVGEVEVQSISLFSGYRNHPDETASAMRNGWYRTGDLAFIHDEELYVIGRLKDIIIIAGKNIAPEDIEDTVSALPGVRAGRVVAFGLERDDSGTEEICVIAETTLVDESDQRGLRRDILKAVMALDMTLNRLALVPPQWLFKTSSGKPCRKTNRQRFLDGEAAKAAWPISAHAN